MRWFHVFSRQKLKSDVGKMNEDDVTWIFSRLGARVDFSYGKRSYFFKDINIVQGYILVYCSCL